VVMVVAIREKVVAAVAEWGVERVESVGTWSCIARAVTCMFFMMYLMVLQHQRLVLQVRGR